MQLCNCTYTVSTHLVRAVEDRHFATVFSQRPNTWRYISFVMCGKKTLARYIHLEHHSGRNPKFAASVLQETSVLSADFISHLLCHTVFCPFIAAGWWTNANLFYHENKRNEDQSRVLIPLSSTNKSANSRLTLSLTSHPNTWRWDQQTRTNATGHRPSLRGTMSTTALPRCDTAHQL